VRDVEERALAASKVHAEALAEAEGRVATLAAEVAALQAAAAASSIARVGDVAVPVASAEGPADQSNSDSGTATAENNAAQAVSEAEVRQLRGWLVDMTARHDSLAVALAEAHQRLATAAATDSSTSSTSGGATEEERAVWAQRVAELEAQLLQVWPVCFSFSSSPCLASPVTVPRLTYSTFCHPGERLVHRAFRQIRRSGPASYRRNGTGGQAGDRRGSGTGTGR
jgi:hypothetical protein